MTVAIKAETKKFNIAENGRGKTKKKWCCTKELAKEISASVNRETCALMRDIVARFSKRDGAPKIRWGMGTGVEG